MTSPPASETSALNSNSRPLLNRRQKQRRLGADLGPPYARIRYAGCSTRHRRFIDRSNRGRRSQQLVLLEHVSLPVPHAARVAAAASRTSRPPVESEPRSSRSCPIQFMPPNQAAGITPRSGTRIRQHARDLTRRRLDIQPQPRRNSRFLNRPPAAVDSSLCRINGPPVPSSRHESVNLARRVPGLECRVGNVPNEAWALPPTMW